MSGAALPFEDNGERVMPAPPIDHAALFRMAPNPYVILDPQLRIVDMNEAYLKVTLSTREAILGRNLFDAFPDTGDLNNASVTAVRESLLRALRERRVDHLALVDYTIQGPDGPQRRQWSATHTPILGPDGAAAFVMQHTVDVTEINALRQSRHYGSARADAPQMEAGVMVRAKAVQEQNATLSAESARLRALFDQAPGFMAVLRGPDHVFEIANRSYLALIGRDDIVGKTVAQAIPEIAGQGFLELLDEVLRSGRPFVGKGIQAKLLRQPGTEPQPVFLDLVYQPIVDDEGTVIGIFVQGHDISEQMRAEAAWRELSETLEQRVTQRTAELEQAQRALRTVNSNLETIVAARLADLRAANEEIQRFAYIVSHDLRSPLVNVMGFTSELETIRDTISSYFAGMEPGALPSDVRVAVEEDLPEAIAFIRSSTQRMDRLIGAILRLSREGRRVLSPEPVAMSDLIESTMKQVAHRLESQGGSLAVGELPDLVSDRLALEQIFGNLVDNAVKYLQPGRPGQVTVRGWEDGPNVRYAVADNGRGIDPRDFERIFDLFRRAGAQDVAGEGIGLAHVRALVRRLGGLITVTSEPGQGTTFIVTLPKVLIIPQDEAA